MPPLEPEVSDEPEVSEFPEPEELAPVPPPRPPPTHLMSDVEPRRRKLAVKPVAKASMCRRIRKLAADEPEVSEFQEPEEPGVKLAPVPPLGPPPAHLLEQESEASKDREVG